MRLLIACCLTVCVSASAAAQSGLPVRLLDAPDASTAHTLTGPVAVRQLRGGGLLVNDADRRQLVLLDASLRSPRVIADSASGARNSYGARAGGMIPYLADSTLFIDPTGLSMFVLGPDGDIARVASIPRSQDAPQLVQSGGTVPALDAKGRLLYRGAMRLPQMNPTGMTTGGTPDSLEIVRLDIKSRKLDTAAYFKLFKMSISATQTEKGMTLSGIINPVQMVDDWAVLSNGTLAIVRGLDYHVDLVASDGSTRAAPKIPFDWQHLTDESKAKMLDSIAADMSRSSPPGAGASTGPGGIPNGMHAIATMHGDAGMAVSMKLASPNDLPDYAPAFESNSAKADLDGNLWVKTTATRPGAVAGAIYDVIDVTGMLIDRVQLPPGRRIIGFGAGGVVYLTAREANGAWIERTHRPSKR